MLGCVTGIESTPYAVARAFEPQTKQEPVQETPKIEAREEPPKWAIEVGVDRISRRNAHQALLGKFGGAEGDGAGRIYKLTVARTIHEFDWKLFGNDVHPRLEIPVTLFLSDEKRQHPFLSASAALAYRWVDFPWNEVVHTTASMGLGIHYSDEIFLWDREANDHARSHLKLAWPFQLTLAHPSRKNVQLALYSDHFSGGGGLFDIGGFDAFGAGLRITF